MYMFAQHISTEYIYIYICAEYIYMVDLYLLIAVWYIYTVLRAYLLYGTAYVFGQGSLSVILVRRPCPQRHVATHPKKGQ